MVALVLFTRSQPLQAAMVGYSYPPWVGVIFIFGESRKRYESLHLTRLKGGEYEKQVPLFDLSSIEIANDNFSSRNVIGKGSFGPVYKLLKDSGQGVEQFTNEVVLIAKLRHRNLVGLLGCCIQDRTLELMDTVMEESHVGSEVLRFIHVCLFRVQECPKDRPAMSYVLLKLTDEEATLVTFPQPKPVFSNSSSEMRKTTTTTENTVTLTILEARENLSSTFIQ
ncbi:hypothetical protein GQ457_02G031830 [Hibiscus cannabinus]